MEQQLRAGVDAGNAQHALPRPRRAQHRELPAIGSGAFHARKDGPWPEIDVAVATVRIVLVHWPSEPQPDRRSVDGTGERHAGQVGHGAPSSPYSCSRSARNISATVRPRWKAMTLIRPRRPGVTSTVRRAVWTSPLDRKRVVSGKSGAGRLERGG